MNLNELSLDTIGQAVNGLQEMGWLWNKLSGLIIQCHSLVYFDVELQHQTKWNIEIPDGLLGPHNHPLSIEKVYGRTGFASSSDKTRGWVVKNKRVTKQIVMINKIHL